eukprot:11660266-Karenia_brevis.AAC.1
MVCQVADVPPPDPVPVENQDIVQPGQGIVDQGFLMVYGDGSAMYVHHPDWTRASWAIVYETNSTLNISGPLPGIIQSIYRAELYWTTIAVERARPPTCIDLDNEAVHESLNKLCNDPKLSVEVWESADLWRRIQDVTLQHNVIHGNTRSFKTRW